MSDDKKVRLSLTDEDMVTSPRLSRRTLLAGVGIALGTVALAGRSAMAAPARPREPGVPPRREGQGRRRRMEKKDKDKADAEDEG